MGCLGGSWVDSAGCESRPDCTYGENSQKNSSCGTVRGAYGREEEKNELAGIRAKYERKTWLRYQKNNSLSKEICVF